MIFWLFLSLSPRNFYAHLLTHKQSIRLLYKTKCFLNFLWLTFNTNLQNMVFNCNLCSLSLLFNSLLLVMIKWPVKGQIVFHKVRTNLPSSQLFVSLFKCQLWIPKLILLSLRLISNGLCFLAPPWGIRDLSSLAGDGTCVPWQWKSRVLTTGPPGKSDNIKHF